MADCPATLRAAQNVDYDAAQNAVYDAAQNADYDTAQHADYDTAQNADYDTAQDVDYGTAQEAIEDPAQNPVYESKVSLASQASEASDPNAVPGRLVKDEKAFLQRAAGELIEDLDEVFGEFGLRDQRVDVMEVCCEEGSLL